MAIIGPSKNGCPGGDENGCPGGDGQETEPKALTKLGLDPRHRSAKVKGIGHGYWRVVAEVEDLIDLAAQFKQRTLYGIGFAHKLVRV